MKTFEIRRFDNNDATTVSKIICRNFLEVNIEHNLHTFLILPFRSWLKFSHPLPRNIVMLIYFNTKSTRANIISII